MRRAGVILVGLLLLGAAAWLLLGGDPTPRRDSPVLDPTAAVPEESPTPPPAPAAPTDLQRAALPRLAGHAPEPGEDELLVRVVDPGGTPVPRADLWAWGATVWDAVLPRSRETVRAGRAIIKRPPPGEGLHLRVAHPRTENGYSLDLAPVVLTDVGWTDGSITVVLPRGRVLDGEVVDGRGDPVKNARVFLAFAAPGQGEAWPRSKGGQPLVLDVTPEGFVASDAQGRFRVPALPRRALEARVSEGETWMHLPATPIAADATSVRLVVRRLPIHRVRVMDTRGAPIPDMPMWAWKRDPLRWRTCGGRTNEHGVWEVLPMLEGTVIDVHAKPEAGDAVFPPVIRRDVRFEDREYVLVVPDPAMIEGTATAPDGEPVAWGTVEARGTTAQLRHIRVQAPIQDGRFRLRRLLPGPYRLHARGPSSCASPEPITVNAPALDARVTMVEGHLLQGTFLDPVPGAVQVRYFARDDVRARVLCDTSRGFFFPGLPDVPGTVFAVASGGDRCALLEGVRPSEGPFEVELRPGKPISGLIDGHELRRGIVYRMVLRRGPLELPVRLERWDGTFTTDPLPPGRYDLELHAEGAVLVRRTDVEAGAAVTLRLPSPQEERR